MPSLAIFRIEFDQISGTFSPGEFITGYVIIDLLKPKQVRGLQLLVKGEANTSWERRKWEQNSEGHADPEPVHYKGTEQYLLIKTYLVGNEGGDENVELPRGESTYPFSFQLPPNIPCSFEGEFGHVRYTVKAIIDRPWKYNHECKVAFTVITHLDLNEYSEKCMGVKDDILDNYSCCCVSIGTMKANIAIPVSCYVPGQTAEAVVGYEMCSRRVDIHRISLCLQQVAYFYAREPSNDSRSVTTILAKTDQTSNFQKRGKVFLKFMIPAAPPSELQFCGLIAVNYFLVVHINVSDFHSDTERRYPILMGTIPYRIQQFVPGKRISETCPVPILPSHFESDRKTSMIGLAVSPSYKESKKRADSIKDSEDSNYVLGADQPFAPKYPVFNFDAQHKHQCELLQSNPVYEATIA